MSGTAIRTLAGLVSAALVAGCGPGAITVTHRLPAALPVPPDVRAIEAGEATVAAGPQDGYGPFVTAALNERLRGLKGSTGVAADLRPGDVARVGSRIQITITDTAGSRQVRRWDPETRQLTPATLETLTRDIAVRVDFELVRGAGGERLLAVETRRTYGSAGDPAVRGELGLERPDDPERVPPVKAIVEELLAECVASFCRMIAPVDVTVEIPLRPVGGRSARAGLAAAKAGDFVAASDHFAAAAEAAPDDVDIRFNLAAVSEAAGAMARALGNYKRAAEAAQGKDEGARAGAERVARIIARTRTTRR